MYTAIFVLALVAYANAAPTLNFGGLAIPMTQQQSSGPQEQSWSYYTTYGDADGPKTVKTESVVGGDDKKPVIAATDAQKAAPVAIPEAFKSLNFVPLTNGFNGLNGFTGFNALANFGIQDFQQGANLGAGYGRQAGLAGFNVVPFAGFDHDFGRFGRF